MDKALMKIACDECKAQKLHRCFEYRRIGAHWEVVYVAPHKARIEAAKKLK